MTHSYVTCPMNMPHEFFICDLTSLCVTWLFGHCCSAGSACSYESRDMTHSHVTWLIHMWHVPWICHMSSSYVIWLLYVWHDFLGIAAPQVVPAHMSHVTWLIHTWHAWSVCVWHASFIRDTHMTSSYAPWYFWHGCSAGMGWLRSVGSIKL